MNITTILPAVRALMAQDQRLPRLERIPTTTQVAITLPNPCTDIVATVKAALPPGATEITLTGIGSFRAIFDAPAGRASGKIAVVTGGAQGFGFEIATDLAKQGATVVLADINAEGVKTASEKINAATGRIAAFGVTMNVADIDSIKAGLEQVVSTFGGVDLFVANAGVLRAGSVKDLTVKDLESITLMSDGASIYECTSADEIVDLLQGGQGVFGIAIGKVWTEVEGSLASLQGESLTDGSLVVSGESNDELAQRRKLKGA